MAERRAGRAGRGGDRTRRGRSAPAGVGRLTGRNAVPGDTGGPHVRLGLAWTAIVIVAAVVGPIALAVPFVVAAAIAIVEVVRLRRSIVVTAAGVVLILASAASSVVVHLETSAVVAVVLLVAVALYDGAVFIVGTGSRNRWEGPVAGMVTMAPLTLLVASIASPPFRGSSAWALGILTAVLVPWGAPIATWLSGEGAHRLGALRRLDTLFLVGPAWMIAVAVLNIR